MSEAAREEAALEEEAGPRAAQVHRSGRQHEHTDTAERQRPQLGRRR